MRESLHQAEMALVVGEVPVGAVVVIDNQVIGSGHNCPVNLADPTAHAEVQALRDACNKVGNYRLPGGTLYTTLELCLMCAGAILQARLYRVVFGARDEKAGAVGSTANLLQSPLVNHQCEVKAGVLGDESTRLLQEFFAARLGLLYKSVSSVSVTPLSAPVLMRDLKQTSLDAIRFRAIHTHTILRQPVLVAG